MDTYLIVIAFLAFLVLLLIIFYLLLRLRMEKIIDSRSREIFKQWVQTSLESERENIRNSVSESLRNEYQTKFEQWKMEFTEKIRTDAIKRSQDVLKGKVSEQLYPYFPNFPYDPRDAKFIGSPVDLIVFSGLREKEYIDEIVFIEIKTGRSRKSNAERAVEDAVLNRRVSFKTINVED